MLEWTISGWVIAGFIGFLAGLLTERYIGKKEKFYREVERGYRELKKLKEENPDEDTKVIIAKRLRNKKKT